MPVYMRGVDISPDGTWFAAVTTGGPFPGTLCDTAARFEFGTATGGDGSRPGPTTPAATRCCRWR
ncbi:hypothetical protein V2I01_00170 [Micromonospora sp. BRA006-A]|nr:hypothetical protein [Micromonospora sp. BRA006-A]